jgi:hypothetical protein
MNWNWPLVIALSLILLKQLYKLHLQHKPNGVDYLKTVAALPTDISFLVVSLFIRQAAQGVVDFNRTMALVIIYLVISVFTTVLWRVSDAAVTPKLGIAFLWAFPLNAAISSTTFYFAIQLLS